MARRKQTKTSKAIAAINRRADSLRKLYGENSAEYGEFTARMSQYDLSFNEKTGTIHIRDTKENRAAYRQLNAWAREIRKTPIQVEQRKAAKKDAERRANDAFFGDTDYSSNDDIANREVYNKWLETFSDFFESCYELAGLEGYDGEDALERALQLDDDREEYTRVWNGFYYSGVFKEYEESRADYNEQAAEQYAPQIDPETGEIISNPDLHYLDN